MYDVLRWLFAAAGNTSLPLPGRMAAEVCASQFAQAEAIRYIFSSSRRPRTTLAVSFSAAGGGAATVVNTGAAIALFPKLTPLNASGDCVGFAAFEDSFFVLELGERRSVAVLGRAESCVAVAVEAWNAPPARSEQPL